MWRPLLCCLLGLVVLAASEVREATLKRRLNETEYLDLASGRLRVMGMVDGGRLADAPEGDCLSAFAPRFSGRGDYQLHLAKGRLAAIGWGPWAGLAGRRFRPLLSLAKAPREPEARPLAACTPDGRAWDPEPGPLGVQILARTQADHWYLIQVLAEAQDQISLRWVALPPGTDEAAEIPVLPADPREPSDAAAGLRWQMSCFEEALTCTTATNADDARELAASMQPLAGAGVDPVAGCLRNQKPALIPILVKKGWAVEPRHLVLASSPLHVPSLSILAAAGLALPASFWGEARVLRQAPPRYLDLHYQSDPRAVADALEALLRERQVADPGPGRASLSEALWADRVEALADLDPRQLSHPRPIGVLRECDILRLAAAAGAPGCVGELLRRGASQRSIEYVDFQGLPTALRRQILGLLVAAGWSPTPELPSALESGDAPLVQDFLLAGACASRPVSLDALRTLLARLPGPDRDLPADLLLGERERVASALGRSATAPAICLHLGARDLLASLPALVPALLADPVQAICQAAENPDPAVLAWVFDQVPPQTIGNDQLVQAYHNLEHRHWRGAEILLQRIPALRGVRGRAQIRSFLDTIDDPVERAAAERVADLVTAP